MDLWGIFAFIFLTFLIMSCCGYCCTSKQRGAVLSTPVVVTSATHTAPGGYPVTQMPPPGGYQTSGYQPAMYAPYPPQSGVPAQVHMPMPMPMPAAQPPMPGMQQHTAPYPPMPAPSAGTAVHMNPPSYDAAVAASGNTVPYEKQAPYNPSFTAQ